MTKTIHFPMAVILGAFVGLSSPALAEKGGGGSGQNASSTHPTGTGTPVKAPQRSSLPPSKGKTQQLLLQERVPGNDKGGL